MNITSNELEANLRNLSGRIINMDADTIDRDVQSHQTNVYRATKDDKTLLRVINGLFSGKLVAVIPESASKDYEEAISMQIEKYQRAQIYQDDRFSNGMLALPTSGTTGRPKLVLLPLERIYRFLQWGQAQFDFSAATTSLSISPWNFDVSLLDTWAVLAAGGKVYAVQSGKIHDAEYLKNALLAAQPKFLQLVPSTVKALLASLKREKPISCVRDIVLTGGSVSQQDRHDLSHAFPYATFHNVYGSTEVNDCLIASFSASQLAANVQLDLGYPLPGVAAYIQNDDGLHKLEDKNLRGELIVSTPWMATGYIKDGFLEPLPRVLERGPKSLYPTKDEVEYDGRNLTFLGRRDRTVKIRGQRVGLDEVESVASGIDFVAMAHAWVEEINGEQQLSLAYVTRPEIEVKNKNLGLRIGMSKKLPAYAIPSKIYPFEGSFPLNGNGKPDGQKIRESIRGG